MKTSAMKTAATGTTSATKTAVMKTTANRKIPMKTPLMRTAKIRMRAAAMTSGMMIATMTGTMTVTTATATMTDMTMTAMTTGTTMGTPAIPMRTMSTVQPPAEEKERAVPRMRAGGAKSMQRAHTARRHPTVLTTPTATARTAPGAQSTGAARRLTGPARTRAKRRPAVSFSLRRRSLFSLPLSASCTS